jgi:uncharacterized delta-60 repeat protein
MNCKSASSIDAIIHLIKYFFMKKILLCIIAFFTLLHTYSQAGSLDSSFAGKGWTATDIKKGNLNNEAGKQMLLQKDSSYIVVFEVNGYTVLAHFCKNGVMDTKFGIGGYSDPVPMYPSKAVLQCDGKIVVAGGNYHSRTGNYSFALARYNSNGSLDNSFDVDGKLTTDFSSGAYASSLAIQKDGKIVVAGWAINPNPNTFNIDFALVRYNSNGTLDNTFDKDGKLTTDFNGYDDFANSMAIQADGKIVITGQAINPNTFTNDFALVRYNSNGTLDNTFDKDGKLTTDFNGGDDLAYSMAIQTDGKIVVAGQAYNSTTGYNDYALARYNSNGTLDNSFDKDGKLTGLDFGVTQFTAIAIQTDGKIVVAGTAGGDFALARYNSNGSLDNSFDKDGKLTTDFNGGDDFAYSMAIQPNGKIVVAGRAFNPTIGNYDFALARYYSNGSLDNSFDKDGKLTGFYLPGITQFTAIAIQADGKIVAAGWARNPNTFNNDIALARYNSNGSLDNSLDKDGKLTTDFNGGDDLAYSMAIQADGKIVVAGQAYNSTTGNNDIALARFKSNGSLDSSFDGDGKLTTDFNGGDDLAYSMAIQPNGKIVVAGVTVNPNTGIKDIALVRYNSNGSLDNSFDKDGKLTTNFNGGDNFATSLAIQTDGKIVVAGQAYNDTGNLDFALVRYNSNGSLDNSFDGDGKQITAFNVGNDFATSLAIQSNGKIVVAGYVYNPNTPSYDFALVRYNSNGSLDNSFDGDGKLTTDFFGEYNFATSLAIQTDGKIVVAGGASNPTIGNNDIALARYNSDGSLDNTFDTDGKLTTDLFSDYSIANAIAIRNNRIYIAGYSIAAATRGIVAAYQTGTTSLAAPAIASTTVSTNLIANQQPVTQKLTVSAMPNPSAQYFTLKLQSTNTSTVTISITDAAGRLIEMKANVNANSSLLLGQNYPPGIYFAQIVQGDKKEVVKLVKQ